MAPLMVLTVLVPGAFYWQKFMFSQYSRKAIFEKLLEHEFQ